LSVASTDASTVPVCNFESGIPADWTVTPFGWAAGGATNSSPNIVPAEGAMFARCGAPNTSSETAVGTMTSGPIVAASLTLEWIATGWAGSSGNGTNRVEILNAAQVPIANIPAPLSDLWVAQSVNLGQFGVNIGDTIHFRAVDGSIATNYSWLAVDNIRFTGVCPADLDGSGTVDGADLGQLLASWGAGGPADFDGSGSVDGADLGSLLAAWGACPG
jgi:hypothetical protein